MREVLNSPIMAGAHLPQLVRAHAIHRLVVRLLVILDRNLRCHAAHGVHPTLMARLDQQLHIRIHEWHRHGHCAAIWQHKVGVLAELLDCREDVVPAPAVEARRVLAQLIDDLVHLKRGQDRLDQHRSADGAAGEANVVLGEVEGVVPEARLEVRLHLGEVEVRTKALLNCLARIVEEVQAKVEEGAGNRLAIDSDVLLVEVPAARAHDESRQGAVGSQLVFFGALLEVDLAAVGVVEVDLAVNHVVPCWGAGVCSQGIVGQYGRGYLIQGCILFHSPSKSAMYVQTSEFNAFTTILRSVGPVISTRRSTSPGAGGAPFQVGFSRMCLVSGRKSGR